MQAYGIAGSHAEEVLHSIRTVVAFGGEKTESKNYENHLLAAEKKSILKGAYTGIDSGLLWFLMYVSYALAMWYGIKLMIIDRKKPEELREYTPVVLIMVKYFSLHDLTYGLCHAVDFLASAWGDWSSPSYRTCFASL